MLVVDGLGMWLGMKDEEWIQNFGAETSRETKHICKITPR